VKYQIRCMTSFEALKHILDPIVEIYEPSEAVSIAAIVLEDAFGIKPKQITDNLKLTEAQTQQLDAIIARLLTNEPVQYVLGKTVFYGMVLKVNPSVLIPRQETEELVAWVIETADGGRLTADGGAVHRPPSTVRRFLDIGTGSGCIPISIKKKRPDLEVHALDVSAGALETARENAALNNVEVHFRQVDILDEKQWETLPMFDVIASNPPYITEDEKDILPKNVVDYEPHLALFSGGNDAQRFIKKIADFAVLHLRPGGYLFFETNEFYAPDSQRILEEKGFAEVELRKDLNGKERMIRARKPAG
jgi:release factor glutamine methyltransferase